MWTEKTFQKRWNDVLSEEWDACKGRKGRRVPGSGAGCANARWWQGDWPIGRTEKSTPTAAGKIWKGGHTGLQKKKKKKKKGLRI